MECQRACGYPWQRTPQNLQKAFIEECTFNRFKGSTLIVMLAISRNQGALGVSGSAMQPRHTGASCLAETLEKLLRALTPQKVARKERGMRMCVL